MTFADDPMVSARWWAALLGAPEVRTEVGDGGVFAFFEVDGVEYGFHPADDDHNPRGGSPVVYWRVEDLAAARSRLLAAGCSPHRGPLRVDDRRRICQRTDPFGTVFGLDGP